MHSSPKNWYLCKLLQVSLVTFGRKQLAVRINYKGAMNLRHNKSNRIFPSFPCNIIRWVLDQHQHLTSSLNAVISFRFRPVSTLCICLTCPLTIWWLRRLEKSRSRTIVKKWVVGKIRLTWACLHNMTSHFNRKFPRIAKLKSLGLDHI